MAFYLNNLPPDCPPDKENPQAFKIYAMREAIRRGYNSLLWCDASIQFVRSPEIVFKKVEEQGYYFLRTAYNVGECTTDHALKNCGLTRKQAFEIPLVMSGFWGVDIRQSVGCRIVDWMHERSLDGSYVTGTWGPHGTLGPKAKGPYPEGVLCYRHNGPMLSVIVHRLKLNVPEYYSPLRGTPGLCTSYDGFRLNMTARKKAVAVLCGMDVPLLEAEYE